MDILMKCALKKEQIKYKKNLNNNFEIQLINEYEKGITNKELFNTIIEENLQVEAIHSPIVNKDSIIIDFIYDNISIDYLNKTCQLADMIGKHYNKNIIVVVHFTASLQSLKRNNLLNKLNFLIKSLLEQYKHIVLALENLIPFIFVNKTIVAAEAFKTEVCDYVRYFREKFGYTDRIGTVLDISHALISINLLNYCYQNYSLEDYFKGNSDTISLIHLANTLGNGYGPQEHGCGYRNNKEDLTTLKEVVNLYKKYNYSCPVTIEVQEDDYLNCTNYLQTHDLLTEILNDN